MSKNRKYSYSIDQHEKAWRAQITRQVSSKKLVVSKEQDGFAAESEAKAWAEKTLLEFASTLEKSNQRHAKQRKEMEQVRRQRSNRRTDKTEKAKQDAQDLSAD